MFRIFQKIQSKIDRIKAKKHWNHKKGQPIRVGFLVHNIATMDCFIPLVRAFRMDSRFDVTVATTNKKFPGDTGYSGEEIVHRELDRLGIDHIRLNMVDSYRGCAVLRAKRLDVIFRQSPWEMDIEEGYRVPNLDFALQCYTPYYGVHFITEDDEHQRYHRRCWKIFVDDDTAQKYYQKGVFGKEKVVSTGLPKFEYIFDELQKPVRKAAQKHVVWAPHHAVSEGWLNFATFHHIYKYMLDFVAHSPYHFIFRPHPAFYNNFIASGALTRAELDGFYQKWDKLPNTSISTDEDYIDLFRKSDAMITDGVSFLPMYQMTGKPLIWTRSAGHTPLNELGKELEKCLYSVHEEKIQDLNSLLQDLLEHPAADIKKRKRKEFVEKYLFNGKSRPSENIKSIIIQEFEKD